MGETGASDEPVADDEPVDSLSDADDEDYSEPPTPAERIAQRWASCTVRLGRLDGRLVLALALLTAVTAHLVSGVINSFSYYTLLQGTGRHQGVITNFFPQGPPPLNQQLAAAASWVCIETLGAVALAAVLVSSVRWREKVVSRRADPAVVWVSSWVSLLALLGLASAAILLAVGPYGEFGQAETATFAVDVAGLLVLSAAILLFSIRLGVAPPVATDEGD